jgi:PST family polysaccharide transporter
MAGRKPQRAGSKRGLTHSTIVGFFWSFSGTGVQALLTILVLTILARLITPADFGLIAVANILTVYMGLLYNLGIGPSLIQRKVLTEAHIRSAFTLTIILSTVLTGALWLLAPVFASFYPDMPALTEVVRVLSFLFVINGVSLVARALNHRNLNFRIKARFNVISYVMGYGAVGVALAFMGFGVWALVSASLAQSLVASVLYLNASPHSKTPQLNRTALGELLAFGSGLTLGEIFSKTSNTADTLIVAATLGTQAAGLYGRAYQLMVLPARYFGQVLDQVLFTAMSKVQDKPETLGAVYRRGVVAIALVSLPLSAFLFVLAPEVIHVLLGTQWSATIVPFRVFAAFMLFRTSYKMGESLARAAGAVFQRALRQLLFAVSVIAGTWFGQGWGITGVAVGVSLAIAVHFFTMAQLSLRITSTSWGELFRIHLPAVFIACARFCERGGSPTC